MAESEELIKKLESNDVKEHGKNVIIAAISGLPVVGGPLSNLLSEYLPDWKQERILNFLKDLSKKLKKVESKIDEDYIESEEFAYLFEETFLSVTKNYQKEKLLAFKSILINACTKSEIDNSKKEYFLSIVQKLDTIHLIILSLFYDTEGFQKRHKVKIPDKHSAFPSNHITIIMSMLSCFKYGEDMVRAAISELDNYQFFNDLVSILNTGMNDARGSQLGSQLTNFGKEFCEFVIAEF